MSNSLSDIQDTIQTVGAEGFFMAINKYVAKHIICVLNGHAILFDEDGMWCSLCERSQFKIGCEEQRSCV